jgi:hypothetical protein
MNILDNLQSDFYLPQIYNLIYRYLGKSKTAIIIEEYFEDLENLACCECLVKLDDKDKLQGYNNKKYPLCEYCYAEKLDIEVYSCDDCGNRTFEYTNFWNTENGLFCYSCKIDRDEYGNLLEEVVEEEIEDYDEDYEEEE